jgi:hypothetical protein
MSDSYIDQFETLAYGEFAAHQIVAVVVGMDAPFDTALAEMAGRVTATTKKMQVALHKAGDLEVATYKPAKGSSDPLGDARDVLRRLVSYVSSRKGGDAIVAKLLGGQRLSTIQRRRAQKLVSALGQAISVVTSEKAKLAEADTFLAELTAARGALDALDKSVRSSRVARRAMTPEVSAARAEWLVTYGAAKLLVESVLRQHDKLALLSEVFDDLAEQHRAAGVTDDGEPAPEPTLPAT